MDLYQIRYFLAIAEAGSFTKAAEQLFVSQPSLSAGIKKLEQELETTLLERGGRGVLLTPAGRLFQEKAQLILAEYQSVRQDLEKLKDRPTLRLGTLHSIRSRNVAGMLGRFHKQHPNITIEICHGYLETLQTWLEKGEVDIALTWLPEQPSHNTQLLFHQPLNLAVPCDHPFAGMKSVRLADIDQQPYIERLSCEFWHANPKIFGSDTVQPQIVYSSNSEEWAISLIQAGMGISIMPVWPNLDDVVYVPMTDLSLSRTIGLLWRSKQAQPAVNWFCDFAIADDWQAAH